jgi:hypothetical protein
VDAACAYTLYHEDMELEKLRLEAASGGAISRAMGGGSSQGLGVTDFLNQSGEISFG